jgi:hypothetical protein
LRAACCDIGHDGQYETRGARAAGVSTCSRSTWIRRQSSVCRAGSQCRHRTGRSYGWPSARSLAPCSRPLARSRLRRSVAPPDWIAFPYLGMGQSANEEFALTPSVSAIIPTTGRKELVRAVRSVNAQSYPAEAVIVAAQPGLEDNLASLLQSQGLQARIVPADRPLNGSEARNRGVAASSADLVAFLDDDDWWAVDKTTRQIEALADAGSRHVISTTSTVLIKNGRSRAERKVPGSPYTDGLVADYLLSRKAARYGHSFMQTSSLFSWRETLLEVRWDESLHKHQDWDLFIRLIDGARIRHCFVREPLTFVAQGSANSVSGAPRIEESLQWVERLAASARAKNDFLLSIPALLALRAGDLDGLSKCLSRMKPVPPHFGAIAAFAKEAITFGIKRTRSSDSSAKMRNRHDPSGRSSHE